MEFKELFTEGCLIGQKELNACYFHYFGEIKTIDDTIGSIRLGVNDNGRPVFIYKIEAGAKVGDEYVFPNLNSVQIVTKKEFDLYVKGIK